MIIYYQKLPEKEIDKITINSVTFIILVIQTHPLPIFDHPVEFIPKILTIYLLRSL